MSNAPVPSGTAIWESWCQNVATSICQGNSSDEDLLVAPSLHAFIENLPLVASASKGGLTLALVQVAVTIFVNLTLGGVAQS